MVDANSGDHVLRQQPAQRLMRSGKHVRILHAQAYQIVHIEEAAIVDLFSRDSPVRQAIDLQLEEKMEKIEAARISRRAIYMNECSIQQALHGCRFLQQRPPARTKFLPCLRADAGLIRIGAALLRQSSQLLEYLRQRSQVGRGLSVVDLW